MQKDWPIFEGAHTEEDLERLIEEKLSACEYPNVCQMTQTPFSRARIVKRIKEIIFTQGVYNIDSCLAMVEEELIFSVEDNGTHSEE